MMVTVIQGPLWDPDFLAGYLASWMLNIHSMNIGHLLNHSYFIKCRRAAEDRWRYRVLEDEEGRYPPSHFLITLILNHQSVNCVTSPMTLRCQSTLVFGYEQIWKRGLWGILRKWFTGWIVWNNLHFLLWIDPILIEPFRKCCVCFNHPVQAD